MNIIIIKNVHNKIATSEVLVNLLEFEVPEWILSLSFRGLVFDSWSHGSILPPLHQPLPLILFQKLLKMLIIKTELPVLQPAPILHRTLLEKCCQQLILLVRLLHLGLRRRPQRYFIKQRALRYERRDFIDEYIVHGSFKIEFLESKISMKELENEWGTYFEYRVRLDLLKFDSHAWVGYEDSIE